MNVERLQEYYDVEGMGRHVGKNVKATVHHDSQVIVCDYVYHGRLIAETDLTYTVLSGWTKVTLIKDFTEVEVDK